MGVEDRAPDELERLEQANAELRRVNAQLARRLVGMSGSAAAGLLARLERAEADLAEARALLAEKEQAERERHDLREWVDGLHREVYEHRRQIEGHRRQIEAMEATRAWRVAARYRRFRDWLFRRG